MAIVPQPRARTLGVPFDGVTGPLNAITDVGKVWVGHENTSGAMVLNTGVTAILPLGNDGQEGIGSGIDTFVLAGWHSVNGCGEMTGTTWIEESGFLEGPIMLTNTVSVGTVRDAVIQYSIQQQLKPTQSEQDLDPDTDFSLFLPVVAETYDGYLNDILGFLVTPQMVQNAIAKASPTNVEEGNVGAGAGTTCYDWKGGIGTSSRVVDVYGTTSKGKTIEIGSFKVGVLVQANQGFYWNLVIRGVPLGTDRAFKPPPQSPDSPPPKARKRIQNRKKSSIIVVIATDAPLAPHQLKRLAGRAAHGIARTGTYTDNSSGELSIAFSTVNPDAANDDNASLTMIPNDSIDPLLEAVVQATEEAIINALVAAETVTGRDNHTAYAITDASNPSLIDMMRKYNRWAQPTP